MAVSCRRRIQALWCEEHRSNAWAYVAGAGWRKLDDRSDDACTNLLVLAAQAKAENALVKLREELRDSRWLPLTSKAVTWRPPCWRDRFPPIAIAGTRG